MFLGCFEENDVPWVISVTQTLGLKWSHITTDNQRAHSKYLAASSAALISFGKLMYFYQQVPPATTSSPPSGPAYSWQDILPCLGATSKPPSTGSIICTVGVPEHPRWSTACLCPSGDCLAPSLVLQGGFSSNGLQEFLFFCFFFFLRTGFSMFTHCNFLLTGPRQEFMMGLDQEKISQTDFPPC